jgi:cell division protein FtsL
MSSLTLINLVAIIMPLITLCLSTLTLVFSLRLGREQARLNQIVLRQKERLDDLGSRVKALERHL